MSDELAFDTEKCSVASVTRIPIKHMLINPAIPDAPNPIYSCNPALLSPLAPDVPCPSIEVGTSVINYGTSISEASVSFSITKGSCCDFELNLELNIPEPLIDPEDYCPEFTPASGDVTVNFTSEPSPTGSGTYSFVESEGCSFEFSLAIETPLPNITPTTTTNIDFVSYADTGSLSFQINRTGSTYELEFSDIVLPLPTITPIVDTSFVVEGNTSISQGIFTYRFVKANGTYDLVIDEFKVPRTDVYPVEDTYANAYFNSYSYGVLSYRFIKTGNVYDLIIDDFSVPCADIGPVYPAFGAPYVHLADSVSVGYYYYSFYKNEQCSYTLDITDFVIPCTRLEPLAPALAVGNVGFVGSQDIGYFFYRFHRTANCRYTLEVSDINVPCPYFGPRDSSPDSAVIAFGNSETGVLHYYFTRSEPCEYMLTITDVTVPCPGIYPQDWTTVIGGPCSNAVDARRAIMLRPVDPNNAIVSDSVGVAFRYRFVKTGCSYTLEFDSLCINVGTGGYTPGTAQDDVFGLVIDSETIDFTYDPGVAFTGEVKPGSITPEHLASICAATHSFTPVGNDSLLACDSDLAVNGRISIASILALSEEHAFSLILDSSTIDFTYVPGVSLTAGVKLSSIESEHLTVDAVVTNRIKDANVTAPKFGPLNAFTWQQVGLDDSLIGYSATSSANRRFTLDFIGGRLMSAVNTARLSLSASDDIPTSDIASSGTLYLHPSKELGGEITLYDDTNADVLVMRFTQAVTKSLTLTSGSVYDVYAYKNGSVVSLDLTAWTNTTTRAVSHTTLGSTSCMLVKSTDYTRRYIGTIYATGTNVSAQTSTVEGVWNFHNRVRRRLFLRETTDSWSLTSTSPRTLRAAGLGVSFVQGYDKAVVQALAGSWGSATNLSLVTGIGINSTSVNSAQVTVPSGYHNGYANPFAYYTGHTGQIGLNNIYQLEWTFIAGTVTAYGDAGYGNNLGTGMIVTVEA